MRGGGVENGGECVVGGLRYHNPVPDRWWSDDPFGRHKGLNAVTTREGHVESSAMTVEVSAGDRMNVGSAFSAGDCFFASIFAVAVEASGNG